MSTFSPAVGLNKMKLYACCDGCGIYAEAAHTGDLPDVPVDWMAWSAVPLVGTSWASVRCKSCSDKLLAKLTGSQNVDNAKASVFSLAEHLRRQHEWSERTFGPGPRTAGVIDHIRLELLEIESQPDDVEEWIDVVILALDGAWRSGASPAQIVEMLTAKQSKNEARTWPDWRTAAPGKAIEHVRCNECHEDCVGQCDYRGEAHDWSTPHRVCGLGWVCDGTGPAHKAQPERPEVPVTMAPSVASPQVARSAPSDKRVRK